MARWISLCVAGVLLLTSCQRGERHWAESYPPPNFRGPSVAMRDPAPPPPPKVEQREPTRATGRSDWQPQTSARQWRWIVIHHSATHTGSAAVFDELHRDRGWDELGYHFVIGNGTDSVDGRVEVGSRWPKQKWGAHARTADNRYNDYGIGICLVGNFEVERPTQAQMQSLAELVAHLMREYGIPAERVIGHGDTRATDCPGRHMNLAQVRRMATQMVAEGGGSDGSDAQTASEAMLSR